MLRTPPPSTVRSLLFVAIAAFAVNVAGAQSQATAIRKISPSVFVLADGVATGLGGFEEAETIGGRNLGITAGGDLGIYNPGQYSLAVEVRGSYAVKKGTIVGDKDVLGGLRFSHEPSGNEGILGRLRPYVDGFFGRGQMEYQNGGYATPALLYYATNSNIFGGGGGLDVDVSRQFSVKIDGQVLRWKTPVAVGGTVYSKQVGIGVAYRFGGGSGPR